MRYCTEEATFCIQEINIGIAADAGTLQRLPKLIPMGLMKELAYTGRRLDAAEARATKSDPDFKNMLSDSVKIGS